ncbi:hypothetical protein BDF20DRAFT_807729, partial [Mycotypha africana]|uniref:uncharacterized protein n=1 Tax=Mycotypha africana TaxID=64632 RepID=UPI002301C4B8
LLPLSLPQTPTVLKDDVFLAQPTTFLYNSQQDDTASLSSHSSSLSSSQHSSCDKIILSPCLSPVTSPTNFLYNHEPLFDGAHHQNSNNTTHTTTTTTTTTTTATTATTTSSSKENHHADCKEIPHHAQLIEPIVHPKASSEKTLFQQLTEADIDWCRYCGTTEGVNWRPGPWGKRTLCNKHGCDYKGYGLASRLPRLDLSAFAHEKLQDRQRPVVQYFCIVCQSPEVVDGETNDLILCEGGCSRAYHQKCHSPAITVNPKVDAVHWYCSAFCKENRKRNKVVVELPRKHMPLMHLLPKTLKKKSL